MTMKITMPDIQLIPVLINELKSLINFSYSGDGDLIASYQAQTTRTFEECVEFNYNEIASHLNSSIYKDDMQLWKITLTENNKTKDIGYCVTIISDPPPGMLFSFAFNMVYRKQAYLTQWLRRVEELLWQPYYTALWNKNTRAIDFFKKNGFEAIPSAEHPFNYLVKGADEHIKKQMKWQ